MVVDESLCLRHVRRAAREILSGDMMLWTSTNTAYERERVIIDDARAARDFSKISFRNGQIPVHFVCRLHASIHVGVGSPAHQVLVGFLAPPGQIPWRSFLMSGLLNGAP